MTWKLFQEKTSFEPADSCVKVLYLQLENKTYTTSLIPNPKLQLLGYTTPQQSFKWDKNK